MKTEVVIAPLRQESPLATSASAQTRPRLSQVGMRRRTFLRSAIVGGSVVGLWAMRIFPAAREAWADTSGYTIWTNGNTGPCGGGYAENDNCSPGCDRTPCPNQDCCVKDPSRPHYKYMKSQFHGYDAWGLRIDDCINHEPPYDGWNWQYNDPCGNCTTGVLFRCHDGWEIIGGSFFETVCRWRLACW